MKLGSSVVIFYIFLLNFVHGHGPYHTGRDYFALKMHVGVAAKEYH